LVGYLNENTVFNIEVNKDLPPPPEPSIAWWPIIERIVGFAGGLAGIISFIKGILEEEHTEDLSGPQYELQPDGSCVRTGWCTYIDPVPFEVNVNQQTFLVDKVGLEFNNRFVPPLSPGEEVYLPKHYALMITAANIPEFTVNNIEVR